jgi:hypothetical protein
VKPIYEESNTVNYLDLTLTGNNTTSTTNIFRKPTTTDTTIHYTSNHPMEQKLASYRFLMNRTQQLPLTQEARKQDLNTIYHTAKNNGYPAKVIAQLQHRIMDNNIHTTQDNKPIQNKKWMTFKYHSLLVRKRTNLFRNTNLRIAFRSTNTIQQLINTTNTHANKYMASGVYGLKCASYNKTYVGQSGRDRKTRFIEHHRYIKTNNLKSTYPKQ